MSAQEKHPIDELFRHALADAEAAPPPSVWAGVSAARAARTGGRAWWSGRLLPALLLLLVGSASVVALRAWRGAVPNGMALAASTEAPMEQAPSRHNEQVAPEKGNARAGANTAASADQANTNEAPISSEASVVPTPADHQRTTMPGDDAVLAMNTGSGIAPKRSGHQTASAEQASVATATVDHTTHVPGAEGPSLPPSASGAKANADPGASADQATDGDGAMTYQSAVARPTMAAGNIHWMAPLRISMPPRSAVGTPHAVPQPAPYVLPRAEWWVGAQLSFFNTSTRWRGDDQALVEALGRSSGAASTLAPGLAVGRSWHNGLSLGVGLLHERSERAFRHVETQVDVSHEFHHYMVTLNDQVIWSDVDTVTHTTVHERVAAGQGRRATLLLPVEAGWHKTLGRMRLGLEAGLALELPLGHQGSMLDRSAADGGLIAREADPGEWRGRHPAALLGTAGLTVGRQLGENWTIHAGPRYLMGLSSIGGADGAHGLTDRFGLRFGITHHLTPKQRP